jgi:hypothetical protein
VENKNLGRNQNFSKSYKFPPYTHEKLPLQLTRKNVNKTKNLKYIL